MRVLTDTMLEEIENQAAAQTWNNPTIPLRTREILEIVPELVQEIRTLRQESRATGDLLAACRDTLQQFAGTIQAADWQDKGDPRI